MGENQIAIYTSPNGEVWIETHVKNDTIWLTQQQLAELFDVKRPAVTKHINNIISSGELDNSVCSKMEHTAKDGKKYETQFYNLDMAISVGYRVNSKKATQFRVWATKTLKNLLLQGYSVDERLPLAERRHLEEIRDKITKMLEG